MGEGDEDGEEEQKATNEDVPCVAVTVGGTGKA
jgi:hypothetical protein